MTALRNSDSRTDIVRPPGRFPLGVVHILGSLPFHFRASRRDFPALMEANDVGCASVMLLLLSSLGLRGKRCKKVSKIRSSATVSVSLRLD